MTDKPVAPQPKMHVIERRRDGYKPSMQTIQNVLKLAGENGLRTNWDCVGVLDDGSLCFSNLAENQYTTDLVATKILGQEWRFFTEREYLGLEKRDDR